MEKQKWAELKKLRSHPRPFYSGNRPFRTSPRDPGYRTIPRRLVNRRRVIKALKRASHAG